MSRARVCACVGVVVRTPNRDARGSCPCRSYIFVRVRVRTHFRVRAPVREFAFSHYAHETHVRTGHTRVRH